MINLFINNLASLIGAQALKLNVSHKEVFSYSNLHFGVSAVCIATMVIVFIGMKEVINTKKSTFQADNDSDPALSNPKLKVIIMTSLRAVISDPELVLGMVGALMQVLIGMIGSSVTTLAVQYSKDQACNGLINDDTGNWLDDCNTNAENETKDYIADLKSLKLVITLPCLIIFGILLNYLNPFKFLWTTCLCMAISGYVMTS